MRLSNSAPEHWSVLIGPSEWFRLYHPPQWETEHRQGTLGLRPPQSEALLAVNTIWIDEEREGSLPGLEEIVGQFPETRKVRSVPDDLFDSQECLQGEAILAASRKWWEKLLADGRWRSWTMWSFRRERLLIVVTLLHEGQRDNELESIVRMILSAMEFAEDPADPPEVFAQRALDLARSKFPLLKSDIIDEFQLQIDSSKLNLGNFYRAYVRDPERFEQILLPALSTAVQVQGWGEEQSSPPLDIVKERLMPMLFPEDLWQEKFENVIGMPWIAGLVVLYVVDEANAYWYIRQELLEKWQLTLDELHQIAIENMANYFEHDPMEMTVATSQEGEPTIMMPTKPDTYNAVRLLSHSFRDKMRDVAQGDLVVGAPGRDVFIAVSMKATDVLPDVRKQIRRDFESTDHPLTDRLLLVTADGVSELMDDIE